MYPYEVTQCDYFSFLTMHACSVLHTDVAGASSSGALATVSMLALAVSR